MAAHFLQLNSIPTIYEKKNKLVTYVIVFCDMLVDKNSEFDQKVTDFFPKLNGKFAKEVTVGDLSSMASGLSWDEKYYSPFSIVTRAYFDDQLKEVILGLSIKDKPGQKFNYLRDIFNYVSNPL